MAAPMVQGAVPPGKGLHVVGAWLWRLLVTLVVLLALYVSAGRYAMSNVAAARERLLLELNARLPFAVAVERISGAWSAFSPEITFHNLVVTPPAGDGEPVLIRSGRLRVDLLGSVAARSLRLSQMQIDGLSLRGQLSDDSTLQFEGFEPGGDGALPRWLEGFLPGVERVVLLDNALVLAAADGDRVLRADLSLTRSGNDRLLQAQIEGGGLRLAVYADGVGNPLTPQLWSGDVYVDAQSERLEDFAPLWEKLAWPFRLAGSTRAQFWLTRSGGDSQARLRVDGAGMVVAERGGAWSLPLDALSFEAAITQRRNHWELLAEDFHAQRDGRELNLERVQFEWWGSALRLRAQEFGLDALPTLLAAAPGIPRGLREALPTLAPTGRVESLELRLDDLAAPASSWSLRGLLDGVGVGSWRGAPALAGVSGYLELAPGGGAVQLDAHDFSMFFPKVYAEPMRYSRAWGDIALYWDRAGLDIESGLIHTRGEEGDVRALFSVQLPFSPGATGPTMELLAGLADARSEDRNKYIPKVLPAPLLSWLDRAIGPGEVERAAFIWRGSLRPGNDPHRTVQMLLEVADTTLAFDPAWPILAGVDATVYVDDGRTWARAERARAYDTALRDVHVRVLPRPGAADLAVRGQLAGDAVDGGRLLRESPLAALTANAFDSWSMAGPLAGSLGIDLTISDERPAPQVVLDLTLDGVSAGISRLQLPVEDISGTLRFHSGRGFAGSELSGALFGQPVSGSVAAGAADEILVDLSGTINAAAVAPWLGQPLLAFADGASAASGRLRVASGEAATLRLNSSLEGVTLDAPPPYRKAAGQPLPLAMELALTGTPRLELSLGERLRLELLFADGGLAQLLASIGNPAATMACDATFCAHGAISELDLSAWRAFWDRYVSVPAAAVADAAPSVEDDSVAADGDADPLAAAAVAVARDGAPTYRIDSLTVGRLSAGERQLGPARVDLWGRGMRWQGSIESPWLQGSLTRADASEELHLLVEYLDLAELDTGGAELTPAAVRALVPSLRVDILELRSGEALLGGLGFDLDTGAADGGLHARDVRGELWGVQLAAESAGSLAWLPAGDSSETRAAFDLAFADIGGTLEALGFARSVESASGAATVRLAWAGDPMSYALAQSRGSLVVSLRDGRLIETNPGALAVVSFFNFAEILRRLSLAHMFETGIPFVNASADIAFAGDEMLIRELEIDGSASAFSFSGSRNFDSGELNGELVVTLPVANNLPWVAALAGGPAVAAGVFVVSKVFEKQVNRMSSAMYEVSGAIDDPQVRFRRLFDDRPGSGDREAPRGSGEGDSPDAPPADEVRDS